MVIIESVGSAANEDGVSGTLWLTGPHLTKRTSATWQVMSVSSSGNLEVVNGGGWRLSQADVDAVRFLFSSGNLESGTITMYGMKNA